MNNNLRSVAIKCSILAITLFGIFMCLCWYPFSISLTSMGTVPSTPTVSQNIEMYTQLIFYWIVSIPCFCILAYAWSISNAIKRDDVFTITTATQVKKIVVILSIDIAIFILGNAIFMMLGWNDFAIVYFIIAVLGVVIACTFAIISHYISQATLFKEENEGTI